MAARDSDPLTLPPQERPDFVETGMITRLTNRAVRYLKAGYAVHFRGPAGTGKSSLAMHVAARLGRPIVLMLGDEDFGSSNLVGSLSGYRHKRVVDEFIHSVTKTEDVVTKFWVDSRLTAAVKNGYTLVYDEFTRSRPEANNPLLSVLEERILTLPPDASGVPSYIPVHPSFSAIFTSNPEEYAGVHKSQDALQDRMITLDIEGFDVETEAAIAAARSDLHASDAEFLVRLVRSVQKRTGARSLPTLRSSIMLCRVVEKTDLPIDCENPDFVDTVIDVLISEACRKDSNLERKDAVRSAVRMTLKELFERPAGGPSPAQESLSEHIESVGREERGGEMSLMDFQRFLQPGAR